MTGLARLGKYLIHWYAIYYVGAIAKLASDGAVDLGILVGSSRPTVPLIPALHFHILVGVPREEIRAVVVSRLAGA